MLRHGLVTAAAAWEEAGYPAEHGRDRVVPYLCPADRARALGPAVLIQEGGYDLPSLGGLAVATLSGAASAQG